MARSIDQLSELILKRFYGGQLRRSENQITLQQIRIHVINARDDIVQEEALRTLKENGTPEDSFFTRFENHSVKWSESRKLHYIELPLGYMDMPNDAGIRIRPQIQEPGTGNPFIRTPSGWSSSRREYTHIEGNIIWEVAPAAPGGNKRVEFPTMKRGQYGVVMLEAITEQSTDDDTLSMPSRYEETVMRRVLELLGVGKQMDTANDNVDQ